jgi:hypothetical protein
MGEAIVGRPLRAAFCSVIRYDGACRQLCIRSNCKEPAQDAVHWTCERHTKELEEAARCRWDDGWRGRCGKPAIEKSWFCAEHAGKTCAGCGSPAVRSCDHTGTQFVCGAPICSNCAHGPAPHSSLLGMGGGHQPTAAEPKGGAR